MSKIQTILKAERVTRIFKDAEKEILALREVSLEVKKSEYLAIVGPSGAGKSTLLHILGSLDEPTEGEVFFQDMPISSFSKKRILELRNKKIGFVFQFYHLIQELTTIENILLPALIAKTDSLSEIKKRGERLLEILGLKERKNFYPNQLSGGQQQKVALARALINSPEVLFCDEPTGNLDSESTENIKDLLEEFHQKKTTIILTTHNLELAQQAQRIIKIREGQLI